MEGDAVLMADVLAAEAPGEPALSELEAYARDAAALPTAVRENVERYLAASPAHRDRFRALAPADWTLAGSCLCGEVHYAVRGPLVGIGHCHCRTCRKAHGAAFGTFAVVTADAFSWKRGAEQLSRYGAGGDRTRAFCSRCGTTLTGNAPAGHVAIAVATLDVDPIARPVVHAAADQHAPWFEITDGVEQLSGPFPGFGREEAPPP